MAHSWKVVVKSNELLAQAILGVLPQQYLCTIKQCRVAWVGSKPGTSDIIKCKTVLVFKWWISGKSGYTSGKIYAQS